MWVGRMRGRPTHAERGQVGGMVGVGRLVVGEVASSGLMPPDTRGWSAQPCQPCTAMRRYARWGGSRVKRAPEVARSCSKLLGPIASDDERVTRVFL